MTDRKEIGRLLLQLEENFSSHKPMTRGALDDMVDDLEEFSLDQIKYAIRQHRQTSKWYPTSAELREIAPRFVYSDTQADEAIAWEELTIQRHRAMEKYYAGIPVDLETLARKFDRADRPDGATSIRRYLPEAARLAKRLTAGRDE